VFEHFIYERLSVEVNGWGSGCVKVVPEAGNKRPKMWRLERPLLTQCLNSWKLEGIATKCMLRQERSMAVMGKAAMEEGGTSWKDLNRLVDDLMEERKVNACLVKQNSLSKYIIMFVFEC
jgi:hypothetical protein